MLTILLHAGHAPHLHLPDLAAWMVVFAGVIGLALRPAVR